MYESADLKTYKIRLRGETVLAALGIRGGRLRVVVYIILSYAAMC
jgi:hypothetical protein